MKVKARYNFSWAIWIGLVTGIYCFIYASIPWLYNQGVMPCTFIALPIFLISGASRKDYLPCAASTVVGVLWGLAFVHGISWFGGLTGLTDNFNMLITTFVLTAACCAFHMCVTDRTIFRVVPEMFGGISITLLMGGQHFVAIMITLVCGVTLGLICNEGQNLISDETGGFSLDKIRAKMNEKKRSSGVE